MSSHLVINAPRSVHSPCNGCVESVIQPHISSEEAAEPSIFIPQPAEDRGDIALHPQRVLQGVVHRGAGADHQGRAG